MSSMIKLFSTIVSRNSLQTFKLQTYSRTTLQRRFCTPPAQSNKSTNVHSEATHKPNAFEKKLLVWAKKYNSVEEVPGMINQEVMERVRNRARIKFATIGMALTLFCCFLMVLSGKKAAERGDTVQKQNVDLHKEYTAKAKTKEEYASKFETMAAQGETRK